MSSQRELADGRGLPVLEGESGIAGLRPATMCSPLAGWRKVMRLTRTMNCLRKRGSTTKMFCDVVKNSRPSVWYARQEGHRPRRLPHRPQPTWVYHSYSSTINPLYSVSETSSMSHSALLQVQTRLHLCSDKAQPGLQHATAHTATPLRLILYES